MNWLVDPFEKVTSLEKFRNDSSTREVGSLNLEEIPL